MEDINAQTESIIEIIKSVDLGKIMLPEFQRDFRWELEQTYDLFDSLARGIFIGTIIYGKPSFAISCREIDTRPRRGRGSRAKLQIEHFSDQLINKKVQSENFRLILDGQQRVTSLYRAIHGIDKVFLIVRTTLDGDSLEDYLDYFAGEERVDRICISLHDAFLSDVENWRESKQAEQFKKSKFYIAHESEWSQIEFDRAFEIYLQANKFLKDLLKKEKLVAYYLLDMSLDKFCLFFERSNSRGIQLNFTDILAAKLYSGFNLRAAIEEFEAQNPNIDFNRELIIRAISYLTSEGKEVDKTYILKQLRPEDFKKYWDEVCDLYTQALAFLYDNYFILSQSWMPSENMVLPLMIFLREVMNYSGFGEEQRRFIEYWFWSSTFSARYTGATNEVILEDAAILADIARHNPIRDTSYLRKLRSRITDTDDVFAYRKKANSIYKGVLNLINFHSRGILNWTNRNRLTFNQEQLQDHHIFPRSFIRNHRYYANNDQAQELVDCVANRALIPKITNLRIGANAPSIYLDKLRDQNPDLAFCLRSHLISDIILDSVADDMFEDIIYQRAQEIYELVEYYAIEPANSFSKFFPESGITIQEKVIPIFGEYKGQRLDAAFLPYNKRVEFGGQSKSPSAAALDAIHSLGGTDRRSENGWTFWRFIDASGLEQPLDGLRD